jgi:hypothetical protein
MRGMSCPQPRALADPRAPLSSLVGDTSRRRLYARFSIAADRHRYTTHGYARLDSPNPVQEAELAESQTRDADAVSEAQALPDLAREVAVMASGGEIMGVWSLKPACDHPISGLDRWKAMG